MMVRAFARRRHQNGPLTEDRLVSSSQRHTIKAQDVPKLGSSSIRDSIREQLHALSIGDTHPDRGLSSDKVKSYPAIIGECV